jgi:hypothetical protein
VCGDRPGGVVANTADGQATIVGYDGAAAFIPQAAHPQAWRRNSRLTIAFIRFNDAYRPFWSLKRYSGNGLRTNGALMVTDDAGSPMDLSATLGVGPVNAFASFLDRDGTDWLFGSRSNGSTSEVTAIRRAQGSWQVTQKWALDFPAERFAVERTEQGWHVVGERRSGSALTLRHVLLKT